MTNEEQSVETRKLFRQILKREKFENLFLLSGGVAHNFNNILTIIQGFAQLIYEDLPDASPSREFINDIFKSIDRGANITRQLLVCSGEAALNIHPVNLSHMVSKMICLIGYSIPENIILKYNLPEDLPLINGDANQIKKMIMNLVSNASEAITGEGIITLNSGVIECSHSYLSDAYDSENLSEGTYIYLDVSDTGCGINKEIQDKIFETVFYY